MAFDSYRAGRAFERALAPLVLGVALTTAFSASAFARVSTGDAQFVGRERSLKVAIGPLTDPPANSTPREATYEACDASPDSAPCISAVLSQIDAARAAEGVRPMQLPADFTSLAVAQQLLVVTNLERVDRGLAPVAGLAADLNAAATTAAAADEDPVVSGFHGSELASNWVGSVPSTLLADFLWMYDDGAGAGNVECQQASDNGCWGHRHNILYRFDNPVAMGVGYAAGTTYGPSITELFIGGDTASRPGQADALLAPTWAQLSGATAPAVHRASTSFEIRLARTLISPGEPVTVSGRLRGGEHDLVGRLVTLLRHAPGRTKLTVVARERTGPGGRVRFHVAPRVTTIYTLVFSGSNTLAPTYSSEVELRVARSG